MTDKKAIACWSVIFLSVITTTILMALSFNYIVEIQGSVNDVVARINSALDEYNALLPRASKALNDLEVLKDYVNKTIQEIIRNNMNTINNLNTLNAMSSDNTVKTSFPDVSKGIQTPNFP